MINDARWVGMIVGVSRWTIEPRGSAQDFERSCHRFATVAYRNRKSG